MRTALKKTIPLAKYKYNGDCAQSKTSNMVEILCVLAMLFFVSGIDKQTLKCYNIFMILKALKRNSRQRPFTLQRDVGWCEASGKLCRTHRGAAVLKPWK